MSKEAGWNIRPPDIKTFLENIRQGTFDQNSLEFNTTFTILRNAKRSETKIAELVAATGADSWSLSNMVALPLSRLILFETIAALETEVQMKEDDLKPLVVDVYRKMKRVEVDTKEPNLKLIERNIQQSAKFESLKMIHEFENALKNINDREQIVLTRDIEEETFKTFDKIKDRLLSGDYKPIEIIENKSDYNIDVDVDKIALDITQIIIEDKIYMKNAQDYAKKYVDDKLNKIILDSSIKYPGTEMSLQRLSVHVGDERHTFMLAGAPACGKGTIVAAMEVLAKDKFGVNWDDTVKINTDNHREIVSTAAGLGDDITAHSALNDFEAGYITHLANARVQAQLDSDNGHHLVIDGVYPSEDRFKMGIQNQGSLHVACASVPVDVSVERAFKRGQEIGRFVSSAYLVGSHKWVSEDLLKNMINVCINSNAELSVFNTDVPRREQPIQAMHLDMSTNKAIIYDAEAMAAIYGKKNINPNALNSADLYPKEEQKFDYSYVFELESLGMEIKFDTPEMKNKVDDLIGTPKVSASMS